MTPDNNNSPADPEKPQLSWVWRCTDASIAAGQISMLAALETLIAVGVYWWLALHFDWPWMAFLSMFAAPILLLRSKESITLGVKLLRSYWDTKEKEISRRDQIIVFFSHCISHGNSELLASILLVS